jgi:hypothetical protein
MLACGGGSSSTPSGGGTSNAPAGWPSDMPIYTGAALQGPSSIDATQKFDVKWTTSDSLEKVFAFYKDALSKGDFTVQGTVPTAIDWNRKSNTSFGGSVYFRTDKQPMVIEVHAGPGCPC